MRDVKEDRVKMHRSNGGRGERTCGTSQPGLYNDMSQDNKK